MVPAGLLPVLARPALNVTVVTATTSIGSVPVGMVPVAAATIVVVMPPMTVASTTTPALAPLRFGSDDRVVLLLGDRGVQSRSAVGDLCNVFVAQAHLGLLGMHSGRPVDTCHGAPLVRQDEADDGAVLTSASGTAGPVQVVLGVHRWIDLQHEGDVIDVNTARGHVGGDEHRQGAFLEGGEHSGPSPLGESTVQGTSHDASLTQLFGHSGGTTLGACENDGVAGAM